MKDKQEFGKLRKILFPIHQSELRKFIPLTSLFFMISFNYSTLRSLKDIFLMERVGAEVIYYIKLYGVTPGIILLTILYSKVSKMTDRDGRFNIVVSYFLIFFGLSYFIFIPNLAAFQLDTFADSIINTAPMLKNLAEAIRFWPLSLFYINAEAWGTMVLGVLFWTFVNEITNLEQSKRFYSFLSLGAAIGLIASGTLLKNLQKDFNLTLGLGLMLIASMLVVYNIFVRDIKKHPALYAGEKRAKKKKEKLSLMESIKFLMKSEYLAQIATLVLVYGTFISLFEAVWKAQIKALTQGDGGMLANIYGNQGIANGVLSLIFILFLSAPIMKKGWRFAASFTPVVGLTASLVFFSFLLFQDYLGGLTAFLGMSPLELAVAFGLLNVIFIKSVKYILFDPTKEQAYIPLDEESRVRGKAAVDGAGSRLGKSLGSLILTTALVPVFGSIDQSRSVIFIIILVTLFLWLRAVGKLSVLLKKLTSEKASSEE